MFVERNVGILMYRPIWNYLPIYSYNYLFIPLFWDCIWLYAGITMVEYGRASLKKWRSSSDMIFGWDHMTTCGYCCLA